MFVYANNTSLNFGENCDTDISMLVGARTRQWRAWQRQIAGCVDID